MKRNFVDSRALVWYGWMMEVNVALDLEIAGEVRHLTEVESRAVAPIPTIKRLRDSHHAVARLLARGMSPWQVSLQTGYSPSRISILQRDPTFIELKTFYERDEDATAQEFEAILLGVSRDAIQEIQERIQDAPEQITMSELVEIAKVTADRAGFAPITRSINKNISYNIGDRMDALEGKKKDAA